MGESNLWFVAVHLDPIESPWLIAMWVVKGHVTVEVMNCEGEVFETEETASIDAITRAIDDGAFAIT